MNVHTMQVIEKMLKIKIEKMELIRVPTTEITEDVKTMNARNILWMMKMKQAINMKR